MFYAGQGRLDFSFLQNVRSSSSSQELHTLSTSNQSLSRKSPEEETGVRFELVVTATDDKVATTASVLYNDEGYPDLPNISAPAIDRCACGSEKPDEIRKSVKCLNCKKHICMIKECQKNYMRITHAARHQRKNHTDVELKQFVLYKFTRCPCGEI